ncbi:uncharacterized protein [Dysidea avara]|uniref:uncharacterized protein isoform X2 n=1 Tax=Dysidea avara TaxID=196820 RepID=UPI00331C4521
MHSTLIGTCTACNNSVLTLSFADITQSEDHLHKRTVPDTPCTKSNEGLSEYNSSSPKLIWICKSAKWIPYRIEPSLGSVKSFSADSCKHIKTVSTAICPDLLKSGVHWIQGKQVYCEMSLSGGGWTLVWKHSYMEASPLSTNMFYFSNYYNACTTHASGWCNIPNKGRFNPTEQMIVAYHKGTVVYAYTGLYNCNLDHDWTGGVLVDFKRVVDKCTYRGSQNVQPAPSVHQNGSREILGLAFDKLTPYNYYGNCDTFYGSLNSPIDCRWHNCQLPSTISSAKLNAQMTLTIYVR